MAARSITHCYRDPLSEIWIAAAHRIGLRVERTEDAFAHSDGRGTIQIASDEHLDDDDCLAQMIFHELCHSLIEGPDSFVEADWGLDNRSTDDDVREHGTLRLQAVLAQRYGLRRILAPTTDFRDFYDALGPDPLHARSETSVQLAISGLRRASTNPWWPHLNKALEASAKIIAITADWAAPSHAPALYRLGQSALPLHPSGVPSRPEALPELCATCTWRDSDSHCQQAGQKVEASWRACERYEASFDCQDCGACCREAYHSVTISEGDEIESKHPDLLVRHESYTELLRKDGHCVALEKIRGRYACAIYGERPSCCREFENAGEHCLTARRRVGLSL